MLIFQRVRRYPVPVIVRVAGLLLLAIAVLGCGNSESRPEYLEPTTGYGGAIMGWSVEQVFELTKIDPWFLENMKELVDFEAELVCGINAPVDARVDAGYLLLYVVELLAVSLVFSFGLIVARALLGLSFAFEITREALDATRQERDD